DVGKEAAEGRAADPERLGGLAARVREPFDIRCLAHDHARSRRSRDWTGVQPERGSGQGWGVAARFLGAPFLAPARHPYTVHESTDVSAPGCICVPLSIRLSSCTRTRLSAAVWSAFHADAAAELV